MEKGDDQRDKTRAKRRIIGGEQSDWISRLPDSILGHILSFMDTKSAMRTSVLSKRWRHVWTMIRSLNFEAKDFCSTKSFIAFVQHVLSRRDHSILTSFLFSIRKEVAPSFLNHCIDYAVLHKVQRLKIRASSPERISLTSQWIRVLDLINIVRHSHTFPEKLELPALKFLRLKYFVFSDQGYSGEILSGCMNLETLILCKCEIKNEDKLRILNISCQQLKILEILKWRSPWYHSTDQMISVDAPQLVAFKFEGHFARICFKEELRCLEEVWIDLFYPTSLFCSRNLEQRKVMTVQCFLPILEHFSNIKSLYLSMSTIEAISFVPNLHEKAPFNFGNLKCITITVQNKVSEAVMHPAAVMDFVKSAHTSTTVNMIEAVIDFEAVENFGRNSSSNHDEKDSDGDKQSLAIAKRQFCCPKDSVVRATPESAPCLEMPRSVLAYLLECSPCAELLVFELARSDAETA